MPQPKPRTLAVPCCFTATCPTYTAPSDIGRRMHMLCTMSVQRMLAPCMHARRPSTENAVLCTPYSLWALLLQYSSFHSVAIAYHSMCNVKAWLVKACLVSHQALCRTPYVWQNLMLCVGW